MTETAALPPAPEPAPAPEPEPQADPYVVGPGRPPLHGRFRPGVSGNPRGRPRRPRAFLGLFTPELRAALDKPAQALDAWGSVYERELMGALVEMLTRKALDDRSVPAARLLCQLKAAVHEAELAELAELEAARDEAEAALEAQAREAEASRAERPEAERADPESPAAAARGRTAPLSNKEQTMEDPFTARGDEDAEMLRANHRARSDVPPDLGAEDSGEPDIEHLLRIAVQVPIEAVGHPWLDHQLRRSAFNVVLTRAAEDTPEAALIGGCAGDDCACQAGAAALHTFRLRERLFRAEDAARQARIQARLQAEVDALEGAGEG